tara:strand:+ start:342 stop:476 length:135 start_codon:yes stop_codon:yes gene_type:complete
MFSSLVIDFNRDQNSGKNLVFDLLRHPSQMGRGVGKYLIGDNSL